MFCDFDTKYRICKSDKTADALRCYPLIPNDVDSELESEEYETISYITVCEELENVIDLKKLALEYHVFIQERSSRPS